jgi:hypothetical protein
VRYVHLTKAKHIHKRQTLPLVRGLWPQGFSCKKKSLVLSLKGLDAKMNWLAVNCHHKVTLTLTLLKDNWDLRVGSRELGSSREAEKRYRYSWVGSWQLRELTRILHGRLWQEDLSAGRWRISVRSRCQETAVEDTEGWKILSGCCSELWSVEIIGRAVITCTSELCQ